MSSSTTSRKHFSASNPAIFSLVFLLATLVPASMQAQTTAFPGKFICGYEEGNVPFLSDPSPLPDPPVTAEDYEDLKPGNYATVFNIFNLNPSDQVVEMYVSIESEPVVRVATLTARPFATLTVGCRDLVSGLLASSLASTLDGSAFEGFLVPVTANANFVVDAVYTYESQNGFKEHIFVRSNGGQSQNQFQFSDIQDTLGGVTGSSSVYLGPAGGFPALGPVVGGSGAGGLGLGASIDVERLPAVPIDGDILGDVSEGSDATDDKP